jgi:hypothetical protein
MLPVTIYFPRNSFLTESFSRKLEAFEAAGLIKFWASAHMDTKQVLILCHGFYKKLSFLLKDI